MSASDRIQVKVTLKSASSISDFFVDVRKEATGKEIFESLARQYGAKVDIQYSDRYGCHYLAGMGISKDGKNYDLNNIQIYDSQGRMLVRIGENKQILYLNLDTMTAADCNNLIAKDDSYRGSQLQDALPNPIQSLAQEDNFDRLHRRVSGGGSHADDVSKEAIQYFMSQKTVLARINADTEELFTEHGEKIGSSAEFAKFMLSEFGNSGMPKMPEVAIPSFNTLVDNALNKLIPELKTALVNDTSSRNTMDGMPSLFTITLKFVAQRFDAFDRYQVTFSSQDANESSSCASKTFSSEGVQNEKETSSLVATSISQPAFYVDFPTKETFAELKVLEQLATRTDVREERNASQGQIKQEESQLMRLLMNPTERKLWGKLFGLPDDEIQQIVSDTQSPKIKISCQRVVVEKMGFNAELQKLKSQPNVILSNSAHEQKHVAHTKKLEVKSEIPQEQNQKKAKSKVPESVESKIKPLEIFYQRKTSPILGNYEEHDIDGRDIPPSKNKIKKNPKSTQNKSKKKEDEIKEKEFRERTKSKKQKDEKKANPPKDAKPKLIDERKKQEKEAKLKDKSMKETNEKSAKESNDKLTKEKEENYKLTKRAKRENMAKEKNKKAKNILPKELAKDKKDLKKEKDKLKRIDDPKMKKEERIKKRKERIKAEKPANPEKKDYGLKKTSSSKPRKPEYISNSKQKDKHKKKRVSSFLLKWILERKKKRKKRTLGHSTYP